VIPAARELSGAGIESNSGDVWARRRNLQGTARPDYTKNVDARWEIPAYNAESTMTKTEQIELPGHRIRFSSVVASPRCSDTNKKAE